MSPFTRFPLAVGLAVAATGAGLPGAPAPARAATAGVRIDYEMAPRFGPDRNHDGIPNDPHNTARTAQPGTYRVTLDGCANPSPSYRWRVGSLTPFTTSTCRTDVALPAGLVFVALTLADGRGGATIIWVRDILIVAMGDSVASGEGAPDVPASATGAARWQDVRCHRSSRSGPARAARRIEALDPHSSVTFVHVACSGAGIDAGVLGPLPVGGRESDPTAGSTATPPEAQVARVVRIIGARRIGAVVLSAGANDVGFGRLVARCVLQDRCDVPTDQARVTGSATALAVLGLLCVLLPAPARAACDALRAALTDRTTGPSAAREFEHRLQGLGAAYARAALRFAAPRTVGGLGVSPGRVLLTEYFDPSGNDAGEPCDPRRAGPDLRRVLPGVGRSEFAWVRTALVPRLNAEGAAAAGKAGWRVVGDLAAAFAKGGYCAGADRRLVRRLDESLLVQHDHRGTLHPNDAGQRVYAGRIASALGAVLG